jgi:Sulfatase
MTALVLGAAALVAGALALAGFWRGGDDEATAGYAPDAKGRPPVVVLILDEFPTDDLLRPNGAIDARRFPNFARLASISTWFPNAFTVYDSTFKAIPAILDARLPAQFSKPDVRSHQPSVYHLMHRLGYEIHKVESATAVCPPRICKGSSPRRPSVLDRLKGSGRPARLHKWIGAIRRRERPGFYLHHALLPHEPWIYLPSGLPNRPYGEDPIEGINTKPSFADADLSQHNHMRHLLQVGYTDHELGRLLDRLERTRLLKRALVVVVADHGYAYDVGVPSRRFVSDSNVDEVAPVPLFIKAPNQMRGRVDGSMVRTIDVVPTIGDMLGRSIWWPHDGDSVFSPASKERDEVVITTRDFKREIRIGAEELAERRAANRARWARLFGTSAYSERTFGDPWASVYRIGPNQRVLGRRLARLDLGGSVSTALHATPLDDERGGRVRARIANAELLDEVAPDSPIRPTRVAGRLVNGSADGTRELALVVNGRIRAVGRSFHLGRRPTEFFSFVFPEHALRRGRNHVEVLEVVDGGRSFVPLGGNHGAGR